MKTKRSKKISVIWKDIGSAIIIGLILGLFAKITDGAWFNPLFSDLSGRLGIWVFTATILSAFSKSYKMAAVRVFAFFTSLLIIYYLYTVIFLHFFPKNQMIFWGICSIFSPLCAIPMWFTHKKGWSSAVFTALPISFLFAEGYALQNAYLPVHTHYYLIPWLQGIYIGMVILLLLLLPKDKKQCIPILIIAIIIAIILIKLNVLSLLFGGRNSYF